MPLEILSNFFLSLALISPLELWVAILYVVSVHGTFTYKPLVEESISTLYFFPLVVKSVLIVKVVPSIFKPSPA